MKKLLINALGLAAVAALVFLLLQRAPGTGEVDLSYLSTVTGFYDGHPWLCVALFAAAHLFCSATGLPGGCTILNITSGAVFGFWLGCAVVYPVTLLSAALVYAFASRLRGRGVFRRYEARLAPVSSRLRRRDYWFLVSLRLSPFLPFGALNFFLSLLGVPFRLFFLTTAVGVFFDVTLLNNLGAGLRAASGASPHSPARLAAGFFVLLILFLMLRRWLPKSYDTSLEQVA